MTPPTPLRYLSVDEVEAINAAVLSGDGQASVLRDSDVLAGAVERPKTAAYYEQADLVTQAARLIAAIALAHAFKDGNKRTALLAGAVFLDLNGYTIDVAPSDDAFGRQVEALVVASHLNADTAMQRLEAWLRPHVAPKP